MNMKNSYLLYYLIENKYINFYLDFLYSNYRFINSLMFIIRMIIRIFPKISILIISILCKNKCVNNFF